MPNDCWNRIVVKATATQIQSIRAEDFHGIPDWALKVQQVGRGAIVFRLWSPNAPAEDFLTTLFAKYEGIWLKNDWNEEGGMAGIIVGTRGDIARLDWDEGCIEEWDHRLRKEETEQPLHT